MTTSSLANQKHCSNDKSSLSDDVVQTVRRRRWTTCPSSAAVLFHGRLRQNSAATADLVYVSKAKQNDQATTHGQLPNNLVLEAPAVTLRMRNSSSANPSTTNTKQPYT